MPAFAQISPPGTEATEPNQQSEIVPLENEAEKRAGFLADTKFVIKPRVYYMDRDRDENQDTVGLGIRSPAVARNSIYLAGRVWPGGQARNASVPAGSRKLHRAR